MIFPLRFRLFCNRNKSIGGYGSLVVSLIHMKQWGVCVGTYETHEAGGFISHAEKPVRMSEGLDHLTPDDSIFLDEDVLRDDYDPDRILERDDKLNEYLKMFSEVVRKKRPRNIFVYGPTGVGKTVGTRLVLDRLKEDAAEIEGVDVRTEHMECKDLNTSYQVAANLVNQLRKGTDRDSISTTGHPEGTVYDMLFNELRAIDETHVIIALDEIDNIGTSDNLLYKLGRCNDRNSAKFVDPENTKVGLVGITNDGTFRQRLDSRVQSTLSEREIHFPPYDANELRTILNDRATDAFQTDVLSEDTIPLVAAFAAQRSGYARTALELLYKAGKIASDKDAELVTEDHVREAEDRIQKGAIVTEVGKLSMQGKVVTYTLVKMHEASELPAKMDKLYARYETYANQLGLDPVTPRTVSNILNDLMLNGVVRTKEVNKGIQGGRFYKYNLGAKRSLILQGLKDDSRINDLGL